MVSGQHGARTRKVPALSPAAMSLVPDLSTPGPAQNLHPLKMEPHALEMLQNMCPVRHFTAALMVLNMNSFPPFKTLFCWTVLE